MVKLAKAGLFLGACALAAALSGAAQAHGGRGHFGHHHRHAFVGVFVGPPYFYYPPAYVAPAEPLHYIEKSDEQASRNQGQGYWYYCAGSNAYYPYVRECLGGWQQVAPQPPGS